MKFERGVCPNCFGYMYRNKNKELKCKYCRRNKNGNRDRTKIPYIES